MSAYRSQAVASVVLGTPLAFALCGLYATFGPAAPETNFLTGVFLLLPVWIAIMIWGLKREGARDAWKGLGGASLVMVAVVVLSSYLLRN